VPLDAAVSPSHVLVGNVDEGMNPDAIRWTTWTFPKSPTTLVVDNNTTTKRTQFRYGSLQNDVHVYREGLITDNLQAINSYIETALLPEDASDADPVIYQFGSLQIRVKGHGALNILVSGLDRNRTFQPAGFALSLTPGRTLERLLNFQDERASVKIGTNDADSFFQLIRLKLYAMLLWTGRVNV
jgi:hypothetical protein